MDISDRDEDHTALEMPEMPTAREWWDLLGYAFAIIAISVLWTFWA